MKKQSTSKANSDIPELRRDQLGTGVRGKYLKQFTQDSNVVVLRPELRKAFPTSEAVNEALAGLLALTEATKALSKQSTRKRVTA
ncbi:MAG: hypothetical protein RLZZ271_1389 [Pseudomonadota bacterium]|jgi:hypothetical protein